MKPVLFVTGHVDARPRRRVRAPARARSASSSRCSAGRHQHGAPAGRARRPSSRTARSSQREVGALVASGAYGAVIVGTGGRVALPLAWRAARAARGVPFVFWAALWRTPRTAAHLAALPLMRDIYRDADAVVTYGQHVSAYVRAHGATRVLVAPQSVDNAFWSAPAQPRADARFAALFVGRAARRRALEVALEAWRRAGRRRHVHRRRRPTAPLPAGDRGGPRRDPPALRNLYAASDVLVVPSIGHAGFIEPWGLVVNEAMNQAHRDHRQRRRRRRGRRARARRAQRPHRAGRRRRGARGRAARRSRRSRPLRGARRRRARRRRRVHPRRLGAGVRRCVAGFLPRLVA